MADKKLDNESNSNDINKFLGARTKSIIDVNDYNDLFVYDVVIAEPIEIFYRQNELLYAIMEHNNHPFYEYYDSLYLLMLDIMYMICLYLYLKDPSILSYIHISMIFLFQLKDPLHISIQ